MWIWGRIRKAVEEKVRTEKLKAAAEQMDAYRRKTLGVRFDSMAEIGKMRDER